jgi:GMP synthase (glutamine-hydrolysing)
LIGVLDFGSQYNLLIARRIRQLGVYAELFPYDVGLETLRRREVEALILSGGPSSALEGRYLPKRELLEAGLPVLGICYGMQAISHLLGGSVVRGESGEYGKSPASMGSSIFTPCGGASCSTGCRIPRKSG